MDIFLLMKGSQVGPYQFTDIQGWVKAGYIKEDDPAWFEGCDDWVKVKEIPGFDSSHDDHNLSSDLLPPFEAYFGSEPYIFISYAHKDSEFVFNEISALHDAGYHIWYDEGIEASNEWPEEIANTVIGCTAFLVFVSPRSTASVNCRNEINLALNEDKPFLAVHIEESALPPGLRLRMGDLQAILKYKLPQDRYDKKLYDALEHLLGRKKKKVRPESASPTKFAQTNPDYVSSPKSRKKKKIVSQQSKVVIAPAKKKLPRPAGLVIALLLGLFGTYQFLINKYKSPPDEGAVSRLVSDSRPEEGEPWASPVTGMEKV